MREPLPGWRIDGLSGVGYLTSGPIDLSISKGSGAASIPATFARHRDESLDTTKACCIAAEDAARAMVADMAAALGGSVTWGDS